MKQLPGFINPELPNHVCHLKRALCGLNQAPKSWFELLLACLLRLGFICSQADS